MRSGLDGPVLLRTGIVWSVEMPRDVEGFRQGDFRAIV